MTQQQEDWLYEIQETSTECIENGFLTFKRINDIEQYVKWIKESLTSDKISTV